MTYTSCLTRNRRGRYSRIPKQIPKLKREGGPRLTKCGRDRRTSSIIKPGLLNTTGHQRISFAELLCNLWKRYPQKFVFSRRFNFAAGRALTINFFMLMSSIFFLNLFVKWILLRKAYHFFARITLANVAKLKPIWKKEGFEYPLRHIGSVNVVNSILKLIIHVHE